jgi:isocitrate/isopropylmalate dehydrogenase
MSATHTVTLIPGDGIGPEVTDATVRILEATGVKFEWERQEADADRDQNGTIAGFFCRRRPICFPLAAAEDGQ